MVLKAIRHCGGPKFEVSDVPESVTRCSCSFSSKRGALWADYDRKQFTLTTQPPKNVASCRWKSKTVTHNFCATCGCGIFTETPNWVDGKPDFDNPRIAVNAHIFGDFDLQAVPVVVIDGKNLW